MLFEFAVGDDGDVIGDEEGFEWVVGDPEGGAGLVARGAGRVGGLDDDRREFEPGVAIEAGEGLIEDQQLWIGGEGAGEGDAALLSAGELAGFAFGVVGEAEDGEKVIDAGLRVVGGE